LDAFVELCVILCTPSEPGQKRLACNYCVSLI
jgi:hypothetical protein